MLKIFVLILIPISIWLYFNHQKNKPVIDKINTFSLEQENVFLKVQANKYLSSYMTYDMKNIPLGSQEAIKIILSIANKGLNKIDSKNWITFDEMWLLEHWHQYRGESTAESCLSQFLFGRILIDGAIMKDIYMRGRMCNPKTADPVIEQKLAEYAMNRILFSSELAERAKDTPEELSRYAVIFSLPHIFLDEYSHGYDGFPKSDSYIESLFYEYLELRCKSCYFFDTSMGEAWPTCRTSYNHEGRRKLAKNNKCCLEYLTKEAGKKLFEKS